MAAENKPKPMLCRLGLHAFKGVTVVDTNGKKYVLVCVRCGKEQEL